MTRPNLPSRLANDKRGNVAITLGLAVVPAVMFIGGAVDFGNAYKAKQKIQAATDAAVLAAAAMPSGTTIEAREARATAIFMANTIGLDVTSKFETVNNSVRVEAKVDVPTAFLKIANINKLTVGNSTRGRVSYATKTITREVETPVFGGKVCLLALDPSASTGFISQGSPRVNYEGCWAHTNSTQPTALAGGGSAIVEGAGHSAIGGVSSTALGVYTPTPIGGQPEIADPFATVSAYTLPFSSYTSTFTPPTIPGSCKASGLDLKKGSFELEPGRYCGGISISSGATVNFLPGEYIIDNGIFNIQSGSTVNGSDVLFYFSGASARFQVIGGGQGSVNLKGRSSGTAALQGFLFIAHPDAWRGLTSNIQGGSSFTMEGMIYAPTQNLIITGNGDSNAASEMFAIVAKSYEFRGNGIFRFKPWSPASALPDILPERTTTTIIVSEGTENVIDSVTLE